jgi:hypothetical protein
MMKRCHDIRDRMSMIDIAVGLAAFAALFSMFDPREHGSMANSSVLNALHWLLFFLLVVARCKPTHVLQTDVEVTWLLYGLLLGEVEMDCAPALASILLSAVAYQRHRRNTRVATETVSNPSDAAEDDIAAF